MWSVGLVLTQMRHPTPCENSLFRSRRLATPIQTEKPVSNPPASLTFAGVHADSVRPTCYVLSQFQKCIQVSPPVSVTCYVRRAPGHCWSRRTRRE